MASLTQKTERPYSQLAVAYDQTLGWPTFVRTRRAFETLVRRYGIHFRDAADLGCGTGLFAKYLHQCWGVPVWAIDLSPDMLRVAARNCAGSGVRLLQQDMRCLRLPEPVDLVTSNFDALNHLTGKGELRATFQRIAGNLRPGGHFYFDVITPCFPLGRREAYVRHLKARHRRVTQVILWDPARRMISTTIVMQSFATPCSKVERHRERAYSLAETGRWLMDAGFVIRGVHDEETLHSQSVCPARIVVIAQKQ